MACSNCFNGCPEIISDKCVKYTGVDIPLLGIKKGDSLSYIEQTLTGFLASVLDGTGIKIDIPLETYCQPNECTLVSNYLPTCGDITAIDLFVALIRAACDLQVQVDVINEELLALNGDYTLPVGCFPVELLPADDTHIILQAVINKLCTLSSEFASLVSTLPSTYVNLADLNTLIQNYLNSISAGTLMYTKMVPYTVVEYYGNLSGYPTGADGFAVDGSGYGAWLNVYLCNGNNGTPDKRGRVGVGDTVAMGGAALDADRAAFPYTKGVAIAAGVNTITLSAVQMPTHTHAATSVPTVSPHTHYSFADVATEGANVSATLYPVREKPGSDPSDYNIQGSAVVATVGLTSPATVGISIATTNADAGSSEAHNNIQPGIGCYYIMYKP